MNLQNVSVMSHLKYFSSHLLKVQSYDNVWSLFFGDVAPCHWISGS